MANRDKNALIAQADLEDYYIILQFKDEQFLRQVYFSALTLRFKLLFVYHVNFEISNVISKEAPSFIEALDLLNDSAVAIEHSAIYPPNWVYCKVCYVHREFHFLVLSKIKSLQALYPAQSELLTQLTNQCDFYANYFTGASNLLFIKKLKRTSSRGFLTGFEDIDADKFELVLISEHKWGYSHCLYHDTKNHMFYIVRQQSSWANQSIDLKLRNNLFHALNDEYSDECIGRFYVDDWAYVNPLYSNQFIDYFNDWDLKRMAGVVNQMYFWQKVFAGLEGNAT